MRYRLTDLDIPPDSPFQHDCLNRKPLVEFLASLVERLAGPFVLALDSPWGTGKTTVVRMLQAELRQRNFKCVHFNAWQVDYVTDPLIALVAAIDELHFDDNAAEAAFHDHLKVAKKITTAVAKRIVIAGVKAATAGILDLEESLETPIAETAGEVAGNLVDAFQKEKTALEQFRKEIEKAIDQLKAANKREALIFFIDELDRCRPTFAIEMLERIKHLFDLSNIVFVLSVDKRQLEASISAVYGQAINAPEYLRRFLDLEYGIPVVETKRFTESLLKRYELDQVFSNRTGELQYDRSNFIEFFTKFADLFDLSLRARERCITRLCVVMDQTPANHYLEPIAVACLLVLRSNAPQLFARLCNASASPADVMAHLNRLPGGSAFVRDRFGLVLEMYLTACDPDRDRGEEQLRQWSEMAKDANKSSANLRAQELVQTRQSYFRGFHDPISLSYILRKIDLVTSLRD